MKPFFLLPALLLTLTGCAKEMGASTYQSGDSVGKVVRGTIVNVQAVTIRDNEGSKENALGGIGGAVAGGVAGSTVGKGDGQTLATVGGALAGAVIGSIIEEQLGKQQGFQYVVEIDAPSASATDDINIKEERQIRRGDASIADDVKKSIRLKETQSEMISVIQADEIPLAAGQPVLVIYHDDRPRVVADQSARR